MNNWTFVTGVAYTKIIPEANIELSGIRDMEFYTKNPDTHFQNGTLSDLEVLAIKILATDATTIHYGRSHALLTQGSPITARVLQHREEGQWLGVPIEVLAAAASVERDPG